MAGKLVKRIGHRITTIGDRVRVESVHEITLPTSGTEKSELDKNPAESVERLLKQEGHEVRRVILPKHLPSRVKPSGWYHIVYDNTGVYQVCEWIYIDENGGPPETD